MKAIAFNGGWAIGIKTKKHGIAMWLDRSGNIPVVATFESELAATEYIQEYKRDKNENIKVKKKYAHRNWRN